MFTRMRKVAILMLLAGVSLGVFAGRLVSYRFPGQEDPNISAKVDESLRLYRERYDLTDAQSDEVRRALVDYYRRIQDKMSELRRQNERMFRSISEESDQKIQAILKQAGH